VPAIETDPISCTLSAEDMGPRLARIRNLTNEHLRAHRIDGSSLRLAYAPAAEAELAGIVSPSVSVVAS